MGHWEWVGRDAFGLGGKSCFHFLQSHPAKDGNNHKLVWQIAQFEDDFTSAPHFQTWFNIEIIIIQPISSTYAWLPTSRNVVKLTIRVPGAGSFRLQQCLVFQRCCCYFPSGTGSLDVITHPLERNKMQKPINKKQLFFKTSANYVRKVKYHCIWLRQCIAHPYSCTYWSVKNTSIWR